MSKIRLQVDQLRQKLGVQARIDAVAQQPVNLSPLGEQIFAAEITSQMLDQILSA